MTWQANWFALLRLPKFSHNNFCFPKSEVKSHDAPSEFLKPRALKLNAHCLLMATAEATDNGTNSISGLVPQPETLAADNPTTGSEEPSLLNDNKNPEPARTIPTETGAEDVDADTLEEEKKWPGWPGLCVFRMIVPVLKVGSIIGRKGELIKKMCEDTRARVKILDGPVSSPDRIVRFYWVLRAQ